MFSIQDSNYNVHLFSVCLLVRNWILVNDHPQMELNLCHLELLLVDLHCKDSTEVVPFWIPPDHRMTSIWLLNNLFRCRLSCTYYLDMVETSVKRILSKMLWSTFSDSASRWIRTNTITLPNSMSNRVSFNSLTRKHSSRMRTVRCSGRRGERCLSRGVCPGGCLPGGCLPGGKTPPCGQNDRRLWKYYLATTTLRTVIKAVS